MSIPNSYSPNGVLFIRLIDIQRLIFVIVFWVQYVTINWSWIMITTLQSKYQIIKISRLDSDVFIFKTFVYLTLTIWSLASWWMIRGIFSNRTWWSSRTPWYSWDWCHSWRNWYPFWRCRSGTGLNRCHSWRDGRQSGYRFHLNICPLVL